MRGWEIDSARYGCVTWNRGKVRGDSGNFVAQKMKTLEHMKNVGIGRWQKVQDLLL